MCSLPGLELEHLENGLKMILILLGAFSFILLAVTAMVFAFFLG